MHLFYIQFLSLFIGTASTLWLQYQFQVSPAFACALMGLLVSLVSPRFKDLRNEVEIPFYIGSFIGMCDLGHFHELYDVLVISILGFAFFRLTRRLYLGVGGRLGSVAFLTSLTYLGVKSLW